MMPKECGLARTLWQADWFAGSAVLAPSNIFHDEADASPGVCDVAEELRSDSLAVNPLVRGRFGLEVWRLLGKLGKFVEYRGVDEQMCDHVNILRIQSSFFWGPNG